MQVPGRGSIEFNPLRLSVVRKWLSDNNIDRTAGLILKEGTNANAAVHEDDICRPTYDENTKKWCQRCVACAHLGTNQENSHMAVRLQHSRTKQMRSYIAATLRDGYVGNSELLDPEFKCLLSGEARRWAGGISPMIHSFVDVVRAGASAPLLQAGSGASTAAPDVSPPADIDNGRGTVIFAYLWLVWLVRMQKY